MSVRVTDAESGDVLATYSEHGEAAAAAVAVSSDGKTIYSGGRGKSIHVWQATDAKKQRTIEGFDGAVLELLAAGEFLFATGADKKVRHYRLAKESSEVRVLPHEDWVYSLAVDAKATVLATGSFNGEVRIYALPEGTLVHSFIAAPK
jgi:WD40 repeat protein